MRRFAVGFIVPLFWRPEDTIMAFIGRVKLYTDGCCKGNPGPGGIGVLITDENGDVLEEHCESVGECTNNVAEYRALMKGLDLAAAQTRGTVHVFMDSQLVVKQMTGNFRIKAPHLLELFDEVKKKEARFEAVSYNHRARTNKLIQKADDLANQALQ